MKICVLVKEVPDAAVEKRINPQTGRMDRGGERNLNPYDTHAIEAAMQVKEGGVVEVEEVVAVTMGPSTAVRALHKAVSLGADRSVHLTDDALAGSDVAATGYALAKVLERESPDLVLLGQQSDDGECYTIGAVVADHLKMPSLTQVIKMDVSEGSLRCERQAEYGYDTVEIELPAVISVGDAINEPRYPSLKAIMGAKKKPLESLGIADAGIDAGRRRRGRLEGRLRRLQGAARRSPAARSSRTRTRTTRSRRSLPGSTKGSCCHELRTSSSSRCTTRARSTRTRSAPFPRPRASPPSSAPRPMPSSSATSPTSSPRRSATTARRRSSATRTRPRGWRSRSSTSWRRSWTTAATATRCSAAACSASRSARGSPRG